MMRSVDFIVQEVTFILKKINIFLYCINVRFYVPKHWHKTWNTQQLELKKQSDSKGWYVTSGELDRFLFLCK